MSEVNTSRTQKRKHARSRSLSTTSSDRSTSSDDRSSIASEDSDPGDPATIGMNEPASVNEEFHAPRRNTEEPNASLPKHLELCFAEYLERARKEGKDTHVFRYLVDDGLDDADGVLSSFPAAGACGQSSVRVYTDYKDRRGRVHTIAGSGFLVRRSVLTAYHVVATQQELDIFVDGKEVRELCVRIAITVWPFHYRPMHQLSQFGFPARFDDELHATLNPNAVLDFDLAVIHTARNAFKRSLDRQLYPPLSVSPAGAERLLIGYPNQPSRDSIVGASPDDNEKELVKQAEEFMHYNDSGRVASVGVDCGNDGKSRLSGHRCNSVRGLTGGFLIDTKGNFVGTHVKFDGSRVRFEGDRNWYYSTELNKEAFAVIFESLKNGSTPPPTPMDTRPPSSMDLSAHPDLSPPPSLMDTTSPSPPLMDD